MTGVSKEGHGRAAYLKSRKRLSPQERYRRPMTASQEIGWRAWEPPKKTSFYVRKPLIQATFYRPTGAFDAWKTDK